MTKDRQQETLEPLRRRPPGYAPFSAGTAASQCLRPPDSYLRSPHLALHGLQQGLDRGAQNGGYFSVGGWISYRSQAEGRYHKVAFRAPAQPPSVRPAMKAARPTLTESVLEPTSTGSQRVQSTWQIGQAAPDGK